MTGNPLSGSGASRHLLLVDDEESILQSLRRLLRRDGYVIHTAGGGAEGLEILAREPIGVVVTDQRMPNMCGSEFLGKVKERYPETMRIVLSGYTELNSITDAINHGAIYKFLTKPWDDELLRGHIAEAFAHVEMRRDNDRLAALNRAIIDAVPDALLFVDGASQCIVTGNAAAAELLAYPVTRLAGMPIGEIEPLPQDQCYWEEIAHAGFRPMQSVETEYLTGAGEWVPVRKTTSNAAHGNHPHVLVLAHNLRHERAIESSLERVNAEMASIFEATSEGLLVLDSERRLTRLNRRLEAMWGFPQELVAAALGERMLDWIAAQTAAPDATAAAFRAHFARPDHGASGRFTRHNGASIRWYANPQLLGDEIVGHVFGFAGVAPAPEPNTATPPG